MQKMTLDELISHWEMAFKITEKTLPPSIKNAEQYKTPMLETIEALKELKEYREKNRWIPLSEKMPEDERAVQVSTKTGDVGMAVYIKSFGFGVREGFLIEKNFVTKSYIEAWKPCQEPYKGDNNG